MFMILYKFLLAFILPPGIFILVLIIFLLLKKIKKLLIVIICLFIYMLSITPIMEFNASFFEKKYKPITLDNLVNADAIIILGAGIKENVPISVSNKNMKGMPSYPATARLIEGVMLYKKRIEIDNKYLKVFLSGGKVFNNSKKSEAEIYKEYIIRLGVRNEDIIIEDKSKTTEENTLFLINKLKADNISFPILVTSVSHMFRSIYTFEKYGIKIIPAPTDYQINGLAYNLMSFAPNSENMVINSKLFWEYIGYIYYLLK